MLSRLRDGELALTPTRTSVLLQMVDTVRSLLTSIEASGGEGSVDVSAVVAAISAAMEDGPAAAETPVAEVPAPAKARTPRTRKTTPKTPAAAPAPAPEAVVEQVLAETPEEAPVPEAPAVEAAVVPPPAAAEEGERAEAAAEPGARQETRRGVADSTIRVDVDLLDELMLLVGELVL